MSRPRLIVGYFLFALSLAAWGFACSTGPKRPVEGGSYAPTAQPKSLPKKADEPLPADARAYREIQNLYSQRRFADAVSRIGRFEKAHARSEWLSQAYNIRGLIYLAEKKPLQAVHYFKKAIRTNTDRPFDHYLLYNLAAAQFEATQLHETHRTVDKVDPEYLDLMTRLKFHYLKARLYERLSLPKDAAQELLAASPLLTVTGESPEELQRTRQVFEQQLLSSIGKLEKVSDIRSLYGAYESVPLADHVLFRLAKLTKAQGDIGASESQLRELIANFPQSQYYNEAADLLRSIQQQAEVDSRAIGILLPMSGKFAKFGERSLHGVELAFRMFNPNLPDSRVTLVVEDSGETPEQAVAALEKLYYEHHCAAVIGPLLTKGIDQVTLRAQELGVPLISLAQQSGVKGNYVFPIAVTPRRQAEEVARFAVERAGLRKFAIVHSDDRFGKEYSQHFWDAVEQLGGQIVGIEAYPPGETDFRLVIDKLSGLFYKDARQRELDALSKAREQDEITKRTRKTAQYFDLPPVVDYDAVFIPDEAKVVGQLLPTFDYKDVENVTYLGIPTWNTPNLIKRAGKYAEGAYFVDVFNVGSEDPKIRDFISRYESTFGERPSAIEALAYDAASVLERALLMADHSPSRSDIAKLMQQVQNFRGVTGNISYVDGEFIHKLKVLTVRNRKIAEVDTFPTADLPGRTGPGPSAGLDAQSSPLAPTLLPRPARPSPRASLPAVRKVKATEPVTN